MAKIEVIRQQDIQDCGACSLLCIIKYYNGYVPLNKIRDDTNTTIAGTTAYHIVKAACNYGFDAMGVKVDDIHNDNIYYPAIAHVILKNGLNHFVVIYKVTKYEVYLMDPARGKIKMKLKEFLAIWDQVLILLNPISQIVKYNQNLTISSVFKRLILKNKNLFIKICLINIILMIFTILSNFYFQIAISFIQMNHSFSFFVGVFLLFMWFIGCKIFLIFVKEYYLIYFYKNLDVCLFDDFLRHLFKLPLKFIQNRSVGEIVSRVQDLTVIKEFLAEALTNLLLNSVLVIGAMIVLYSLSGNLFFVLCFVMLLYVIIGVILGKLIYSYIKKNIESETDFNAVLVENIEMNTSIKNLNLFSSFFGRLENKMILMLKSNFNTQRVLNYILLFKNIIYELGMFIITSYGIYLIYKENLELVVFVTFNSLCLYLFGPIQDAINLIPKYNYLKATFQKLTEFINIEIPNEQKGLSTVLKGNVEFLDVSYSYNDRDVFLKNVSFKIEDGEKVMLVGPSGSGKSTIVNSISEPYVIKNGIIKLGGLNVADYSLNAIRESVLYVGQNEKLFTGSIYDNIMCFRKIAEQDFLKVAKICRVEDIIQKKSHRYHTIINATFNNLSGGEKERIILARALLSKAKVLILDEALSEVDEKLERNIIRDIINNFLDTTLIYVSHKNVKNEFSKIINMEDFND